MEARREQPSKSSSPLLSPATLLVPSPPDWGGVGGGVAQGGRLALDVLLEPPDPPLPPLLLSPPRLAGAAHILLPPPEVGDLHLKSKICVPFPSEGGEVRACGQLWWRPSRWR